MRILVLGPVFPDSFARNILATLREMGHEVASVPPSGPPIWFPYSARLLVEWMARQGWMGNPEKTLRQRVRAFEPEVVLNCYFDLSPEVVARARHYTRAVLSVWFPDHLANLGRQYLLAAPYDAYFFKDRYLVSFVRNKVGKPAFYLPECCNPLWHKRVELTAADRAHYACDLATAANMYYYRALLLEPFANYNLKIWGRGYPPWLDSSLRRAYQDRYVAEGEKAKAFNAAKIVLNTLHYAEIDSVNARLFEIAGCGAFQIAEYRETLNEFFEPENEIVTFRSRAELKEKVDHYLAHPAERQAIADRAYARAQREHTYQHRLQHLLSTVAGLRSE